MDDLPPIEKAGIAVIPISSGMVALSVVDSATGEYKGSSILMDPASASQLAILIVKAAEEALAHTRAFKGIAPASYAKN